MEDADNDRISLKSRFKVVYGPLTNIINKKSIWSHFCVIFLGVNDTSAAAQLAKLDTVTARNGPQGDEFDMFAQSRKVTYESSKTQ